MTYPTPAGSPRSGELSGSDPIPPPDPFFPPGFAHSAEPSEDHNPRIQGPMSKTLADGVPNFTHPPYQATTEDGRWEPCAKVDKPARSCLVKTTRPCTLPEPAGSFVCRRSRGKVTSHAWPQFFDPNSSDYFLLLAAQVQVNTFVRLNVKRLTIFLIVNFHISPALSMM